MIDLGLTDCYQGFGESTVLDCDRSADKDNSRGQLSYVPTKTIVRDIIDELALLLTGGKLNDVSEKTIRKAYKNYDNDVESLKLVQKLFIMTPEFHMNGVFNPSTTKREPLKTSIAPDEDGDYKAVIMVFLDGGFDSWNSLIPLSGCKEKGKCGLYRCTFFIFYPRQSYL